MDFITSRDGTAIACWHGGTGAPLLLVHGTTGDHSAWRAVLMQLQQRYTVWTMDRRGRGQSGDAANYALARESEDIAAVVNAIGGNVNVLGHSFGGLCALEAALLTANINKLMLYEPSISLSGSGWSAEFESRLQVLREKGAWEESLLLFFRDLLKTPDHELNALQTGPNWDSRVAAAPTILRELQSIDRYVFTPQKFHRLQNAILLMLGGESHTRRYKTAEMLQQCLVNSRIGILPGQQHSAMRTAPDLLVHTVTAFVDSAP
ncbi:MAG: alpha/beta hydrolase [Nitrosomonas sp.]|nr:MAG: alpha/beta hydrolase [Nitrosomonas sp.]